MKHKKLNDYFIKDEKKTLFVIKSEFMELKITPWGRNYTKWKFKK